MPFYRPRHERVEAHALANGTTLVLLDQPGTRLVMGGHVFLELYEEMAVEPPAAGGRKTGKKSARKSVKRAAKAAARRVTKKARTAPAPVPGRRGISAETIARIQAMDAQGKPQTEIAAACSVSIPTVKKYADAPPVKTNGTKPDAGRAWV